jgi:6-phosphogluconate dehydrogenase
VAQGTADIGLIGLGVMGRNLALNWDDHGYTAVVLDAEAARRDQFLAGEARGRRLAGAGSLEELAAALRPPRRVFLLIPAGRGVDELIAGLLRVLEPGDVIVDGGNSHFADTIRRTTLVEAQGLLYVGLGISGGEEGARRGPSLMPGGSPAAWPLIKDLLRSIAARTHDGEPCCDWVGSDGAGHYVKMVHNGIEYGDMQLLAEAYHLLRDGSRLSNDEMHGVFAEWNHGELESYLVEITRDILQVRDDEGHHVLDAILDAAGQKGTGRWAVQSAADLGVPATLAAEALFARALSARREERVVASAILGGPAPAAPGERAAFIADIGHALYAAKIVSYAQGFLLLRRAAAEYSWPLDLGGIARLWRAGCIIRSRFLDEVLSALASGPDLPSLLLHDFFREALARCQPGWRRTVARAAEWGIPLPAMASALAFYDGYRCARLPANLIQAQRDYFGAHTYERVDRPRGESFHTDWKRADGRGPEPPGT